MFNNSEHGALTLMGTTILLWSFSWIVMKAMGDYIGPVDLVAARYTIAFVFLFAIQLYRRVPFLLPPFWLCVGIAAFQAVAFQVLSQFALMRGGAGHVVLLAYTMPFWTVLLPGYCWEPDPVLGIAWHWGLG
ncbi:DMT family transporter [Paenalcaligenes niemegkensis]|uniref:DMT family transporter n=1 Tax=Paenalcaligenes niemegkensis TaxID=2895469 RepID=UPI001EE954A9|nr:DMT family transporter [Paenalcaligenes niemegkensis]MCQ9616866.1 DMT family transporter [Paenalcaligenes niemegkensis]